MKTRRSGRGRAGHRTTRPAPPDVRAVLLGGVRRHFLRYPIPVEEPPQRPDPDGSAALGEQHPQLDQRDVVLRLDCIQEEGRVCVDPGRTAIATLRLGYRRAVLNNQLPPADPIVP